MQVWNPNENADTSREALLHKHKDTVYQDMSLAGHVYATFVRGQQVYAAEGVLADQPCGKTLLKGKLWECHEKPSDRMVFWVRWGIVR